MLSRESSTSSSLTVGTDVSDCPTLIDTHYDKFSKKELLKGDPVDEFGARPTKSAPGNTASSTRTRRSATWNLYRRWVLSWKFQRSSVKDADSLAEMYDDLIEYARCVSLLSFLLAIV
jgi:hypothetical protein